VAPADRAYRMLAHTNQAIVRASSVDELFASMCRVMVDEGGYLGAWVAQPRPSGDVEMAATAGALDDYVAKLRVSTDAGDPHGHGPVSVVVRENRPVYVDYSAPAVGLSPSIPGVAASASLPLRVRGEPVAVLTLYSEHASVFDEEMRALLQGMAENASFGLGGFAAAADLDRIAAQRGELLRRLVRAQEDERSRIAGDVHDDSVQSLAVIDLRLGLLLRRVEAQVPELSPAVAQIQETVGSVTAGLRLLLFELEPTDSGATLPEMFNEAASVIFESAADVRWTVEVDAPAEHVGLSQDPHWMPEPARSQVVRVVKEALINVRKHSGARSVSVVVRPDDDGVEVCVMDDGVGIDPEQVRSTPGHRGLTTMRERVEIGGGWTQIEGGPAGTSLRFWLPRAREGDSPSG
jgi:signal transduction histidine kinase